MRVPQYSLWLHPAREAGTRFQFLIARLSASFKTLVFEPHVTLLGRLYGDEDELRKKTRILASTLEPFKVSLLEITGLEDFFRCLFVKVSLSPELQAAREAAQNIFNQRRSENYEPHVSLVYGELEPPTKRRVMQEIGRPFEATVLLETLTLWETGGLPSAWRRAEHYPLGERLR